MFLFPTPCVQKWNCTNVNHNAKEGSTVSYIQSSHDTIVSCGLDVCLQADNSCLYTIQQMPEEQPKKKRGENS